MYFHDKREITHFHVEMVVDGGQQKWDICRLREKRT